MSVQELLGEYVRVLVITNRERKLVRTVLSTLVRLVSISLQLCENGKDPLPRANVTLTLAGSGFARTGKRLMEVNGRSDDGDDDDDGGPHRYCSRVAPGRACLYRADWTQQPQVSSYPMPY